MIFSKKDHHKVPSRIQDSDYMNYVVFYPIEYIITATDEISVIGLYSDARGQRSTDFGQSLKPANAIDDIPDDFPSRLFIAKINGNIFANLPQIVSCLR